MKIKRTLFLAHRYLGMSVGLIVALWCLSGVVMMYMPYPDISRAQKLSGQLPIHSQFCCEYALLERLNLVDVNRFYVEMLGADPVLRLRASGGKNPIINLRSGELIDYVDSELALDIAQNYAEQSNINFENLKQSALEQDQWTVTNFYDAHRPLHFFSADDEAGSQWYISSRTGEVVQFTTAKQRFWNYFGAVVHWLYPTVLRQHDGLWFQVVVWLSVLGLFLVGLGLYVGWGQFKKRRSGRRSPYRGAALFHHYAGLIMGVFMLTWVGSGLLSMNPGQVFDFNSGVEERKNLQGIPLAASDVENFLRNFPKTENNWVRLEGYALASELNVLAYDSENNVQRLSAKLQPLSFTENELQKLLQQAAPNERWHSEGLLYEADAYYYNHHNEREFPVYRAIAEDGTRYYLSPTSGELVGVLNADMRAYRWLFAAFHQGDFLPWLRQRPWWDVFMLVLLAGLIVSSCTGVVMGLKRWRKL